MRDLISLTRPLNVRSVWIKTLLLALAVMLSSVLNAQEEEQKEEKEKKWSHLVEPYIMIPVMSGNIGLGDTPILEIDASTSDLLGILNYGGMLYYEMRSDQWSAYFDFVFMNVGSDLKTNPFIDNGKVEITEIIWELGGMYRVTPIFDVGLGLRGNYIDMTITGQRIPINPGGQDFNRSNNVNIIDPVIGIRVMDAVSARWSYILRGDIGGFGVSSDLTWQLQGYLSYRFSNLFSMTGGYRYLSIDYNGGSGDDRFLYDVNAYGWVIKFGFNF